MLTARRKRFVEEYLVRGNGYRAAIAAGFAPASARQQATQLLRMPEIAAAIRQGQEEKRRRSAISADRVVWELAAVAFADIGRMVGSGRDPWAPKRPDDLAPEDRAAIAEIAQTPTGGTRLRLHSKLRALEELSRLLGFGPANPAATAPSWVQEGESARERLARRIAELAERAQEERKAIEAVPAAPPQPQQQPQPQPSPAMRGRE